MAFGLFQPVAVAVDPPPPTWTLEKSANPASGTVVNPGDAIIYTLTATNTDDADTVTGATAEDDLSQVLPFADLETPLPAGVSLTGTTLTWAIPTFAPGSSVSVSFSVTVHADALDVHVHDVAAPTSEGGACASLADCTTDHPTPPTCSGQTATIVGTPADNTLVGTEGHDVIAGLGGEDVIDGAGGDDLICLGRGDDIARGGPAKDVIDGGAGGDRVSGGNGPDVIVGGTGGDTLAGSRGDDFLFGGEGRDLNVGGRGIDLCRSPETGGRAISCEH